MSSSFSVNKRAFVQRGGHSGCLRKNFCSLSFVEEKGRILCVQPFQGHVTRCVRGSTTTRHALFCTPHRQRFLWRLCSVSSFQTSRSTESFILCQIRISRVVSSFRPFLGRVLCHLPKIKVLTKTSEHDIVMSDVFQTPPLAARRSCQTLPKS